ncbi:hypothetical protein E4T52_09551 [Aureobasidium sp. EXF-3400]|nr:hypothetical protein E4T51_08698 [Aureobasidium sp. EXF-12344]KAI4775507.1 hypothetical protein E4T52_09551 [Aureobasidium sp. EXF-3400]
MKAFLRSRQHSKASSTTAHSIADSTNTEGTTPATPTEWWLARENAFDTAARVYKKLYRPDSDTSYYSREQDYDENKEDSNCLPPLKWNASRWFWSDERSEMWVQHVASSKWSATLVHGDEKASVDANTMAVPDSEVPSDAAGKRIDAVDDSQDRPGEFENSPESKAEVESIAAELPRRPKLTIQIPSGTPDYYSNHGPNDYSSCRPHITSEERAEWKMNMF